jgi:hypothetical protein
MLELLTYFAYVLHRLYVLACISIRASMYVLEVNKTIYEIQTYRQRRQRF